MSEPIRVIFYNDGFEQTSGYGKVTRELATRLAKDSNYDVYSLDIVDKNPMRVIDNVTVLPIHGMREDAIRTWYISSMVNTFSLIKPHVIIPVCDAFLIERDGFNKINFGKGIKVMPYVPVDSNNIAKGSDTTFKKAHRILVQSEFGQKEILKNGFKSHVFRHGVDMKKFKPDSERRSKIRKQFNIADDEKVFLFIGRNTKRKRPEWLIRGFALFVKNNPDAKVKLIMHGSRYNDYADNIYEQIEREEILHDVDLTDKIFFPYKDHTLGKGESEDKIIDLYHAADWTVSMASGEGTGLMSLESFACGIPTIYPMNSNYEEILGPTSPGYNLHQRGYTVNALEDIFVGLGCTQPLPSYNDLSKVLSYAYNLDETTYEQLSQNCLAWVKENADWDEKVKELKNHIFKVMINE